MGIVERESNAGEASKTTKTISFLLCQLLIRADSLTPGEAHHGNGFQLWTSPVIIIYATSKVKVETSGTLDKY
jgi:hypothetical protein